MNFTNKGFADTMKSILYFVLIVFLAYIFIKILPILIAVPLITCAIIWCVQAFKKRTVSKNGDDFKNVIKNNKDDCDIKNKKVVDVEYTEINK